MTINAIERENVRLATDNRRLRLENAALILALEEIQAQTGAGGTMWTIHGIVSNTFKKLSSYLPGSDA